MRKRQFILFVLGIATGLIIGLCAVSYLMGAL